MVIHPWMTTPTCYHCMYVYIPRIPLYLVTLLRGVSARVTAFLHVHFLRSKLTLTVGPGSSELHILALVADGFGANAR